MVLQASEQLEWSEPWRRNVGCVDCGGIALVLPQLLPGRALLKMALCPRGWPDWSVSSFIRTVLANRQSWSPSPIVWQLQRW